ncbi:MAG TPA: ABC transporter substrate-binding protein, partial [Kofleriaceae bacterium]|nr:ABC transporter substrate-binding protein [Kofleriaceae bacterium]
MAKPSCLIALTAAIALGAGCKPKEPGAQNRNEILIGATLPLTGGEARIGGFFQEGYRLAFDEVNQAGGLEVGGKKRPVELRLSDDTSTQATAVSLADKLINSDHVDFLLGTYSTALVEAQTTVAEQNKVPYVNGGGAASEIYKRGYKYIFGALSPVE